MSFEVGDILLNRYELKSLVAPSGTVWIAYDSILDREVAVRYREKPEADEGDASKLDAYMPTIEILRREAQLFARLQHPQILPVHDFGVQGDDPFIVMRYLPGNRTLKTYLQDSVLTVSEILAIANQLASLLDFFREKEVVHGDFSTHNFLLDEQLQPYIFNLVVSSAHTALQEEQPDTIIGSPPYMAPEAFVGEPLTHQADLYAFGVVLYECFANRLPLDGMPLGYAQINAQIGVTQVRAGDGTMIEIPPNVSLPSVRAQRPTLSMQVDRVLDRLTRYQPNERYHNATDAINELTQAIYAAQGQVEGHIFISYARKDSEYVYELVRELRRLELDLWIDQDIEPGSNWDDSIQTALDDCDTMLLVTTEASLSSEYVTHEWSYFMGAGKPVYPFIPQTTIPDNMHPRLNRVQVVMGSDDMLDNVARIIDVLSGGTPTRIR